MKKRLFLGIPVPMDIQFSLKFGLDPLRKLYPNWRWVSSENYHVTVSFFGEIDEKSIPGLITTIEKSADRTEAFDLTLSDLVFAPPKKTPRMLWAVGATFPEFTSLVNSVEIAISKEIMLPNYRKSQIPLPHITLARFDNNPPSYSLPTLEIRLPVTTLNLFESELLHHEPKYTKIAEFELQ